MANPRLAMDSNFWDLNISTTQTLEGTAKLIPGEPFPLDGSRASRVIRAQQMSILSHGFPLGIIPFYLPQKDVSPVACQSLLLKPATSNWWLGLVTQFRPKKLISAVRAQVAEARATNIFGEEWEPPAFKDLVEHLKDLAQPFRDKSIGSLGLFTQLGLTPESSLLFSTEGISKKDERRSKAMFFYKLPYHDITFEAAWRELFIDRHGKYWDVPESISLDVASVISDSGLRYRFGVHKNSGHPQAVNGEGDPPIALMPGLCAKASFSYEKSWDIWRAPKERIKEYLVRTAEGDFYSTSYDVRLNEPHAAVLGIVGGTCTAWTGGGHSSIAVNSDAQSRDSDAITSTAKHRTPLSADFFGSVCYTFQHGKFKKLYGDLTRFDVRLDLCSASAFARGAANVVFKVFRSPQVRTEANPLAAPRLNVIFQQQVAGPIVFRLDSKFALGSSDDRRGPHFEDVRYCLSYSLKLLRSGKVVAWYSPKRKEGMIELRMFEF